MNLSELTDEQLLEVTKPFEDESQIEITCELCGKAFFVEIHKFRNRRYCDECIADLEQRGEKRKMRESVSAVKQTEMLDFAFRMTKSLCETGKHLEEEWDQALEAVKYSPTDENKSNAYRATYAYFHHRRDCPDCKLILEEV